MSTKTLIKSALRHIDEIATREFRFAVFVCILITVLNALFVAYGFGYLDGRASSGYPCVSGHQDLSRDVMHLKIEIALLVIVIALWFRRVLGVFISLFATLFVEIQYALLYLDTQRWLREMGVSDFSELPVPGEFPHFAGLYHATLWDVVLLVIVTALFAWQVRVLITLFTSARQHKQPT